MNDLNFNWDDNYLLLVWLAILIGFLATAYLSARDWIGWIDRKRKKPSQENGDESHSMVPDQHGKPRTTEPQHAPPAWERPLRKQLDSLESRLSDHQRQLERLEGLLQRIIQEPWVDDGGVETRGDRQFSGTRPLKSSGNRFSEDDLRGPPIAKSQVSAVSVDKKPESRERDPRQMSSFSHINNNKDFRTYIRSCTRQKDVYRVAAMQENDDGATYSVLFRPIDEAREGAFSPTVFLAIPVEPSGDDFFIVPTENLMQNWAVNNSRGFSDIIPRIYEPRNVHDPYLVAALARRSRDRHNILVLRASGIADFA